MSKLDYAAYMLRLWKVKTQEKNEWRASLESPRTGIRYFFSDLQSLYAYITDTTCNHEDCLENNDLPEINNDQNGNGS